jgi:hypothetical protein
LRRRPRPTLGCGDKERRIRIIVLCINAIIFNSKHNINVQGNVTVIVIIHLAARTVFYDVQVNHSAKNVSHYYYYTFVLRLNGTE